MERQLATPSLINRLKGIHPQAVQPNQLKCKQIRMEGVDPANLRSDPAAYFRISSRKPRMASQDRWSAF